MVIISFPNMSDNTNNNLEEPEDYSNPLASLGYQIDTHPSDSNEYMEEVEEVNESDAPSEPELSMKEK